MVLGNWQVPFSQTAETLPIHTAWGQLESYLIQKQSD